MLFIWLELEGYMQNIIKSDRKLSYKKIKKEIILEPPTIFQITTPLIYHSSLYDQSSVSFIILLAMSSGKKKPNEQIESFFPKQRSKKIKNKSSLDNSAQKLPYLFNKIHHNTIQTQRNTRPHKRSLSSYNVTDFEPCQIRGETKMLKYLSSKVDFFNQENQRRLNFRKRKALIDLGVIRLEKQRVIPSPQAGKVSPGMAQLLHDYLLKRSSAESKSEQYYVLGREV